MQNLFKSGSRGKTLSPSVFSEPLFTIVPGFKNYLFLYLVSIYMRNSKTFT